MSVIYLSGSSGRIVTIDKTITIDIDESIYPETLEEIGIRQNAISEITEDGVVVYQRKIQRPGKRGKPIFAVNDNRIL